MRKHTVLITLLFCIIGPIFAQQAAPWWLSLELGKQRFRNGDYGSSLIYFEDARRGRKAMYEKMERDFIVFLSEREVRRIGDALDRVERFAYDRYYTAAVAALEELFYRVPKESFKNSALSALAAFEKLKNFPEAEYWIGEVYRIEGELRLAMAQYKRALTMREVMEDPKFAVSLQYKIASIHRIRQEYNEMEAILLSIVNDLDTLWINSSRAEASRLNEEALSHANRVRGVFVGGVSVPYEQVSASFARAGMTKMLENEGIERFLEMYRYNNADVEQAHRLLGFYYVLRSRLSAGPHLMFSFLIQNTTIIEEIRKKQYDFRFTVIGEEGKNQARNLTELMEAVKNNPLILSYIDEVEYYKTAYYLASSLLRSGHTPAALSLWRFLAAQPQAGEWHSRAVMQLRNPRTEPIIESP